MPHQCDGPKVHSEIAFGLKQDMGEDGQEREGQTRAGEFSVDSSRQR